MTNSRALDRAERARDPAISARTALEAAGLTTLVAGDPARLAIGMPVEVVFEDASPEGALPRVRSIG